MAGSRTAIPRAVWMIVRVTRLAVSDMRDLCFRQEL
jgi:hypothetical protein